jgi:pimeloyl-ACP methyl ester carboxylesterase
MPLRSFSSRDGLRLACHEIGEGRPLVLIHGYLGSARASWIDSGIADHLASRGHRVLMPDMRGHGESARPHDPGSYPPGVLADDCLALIEQFELTDYDLGGYSLGGRTVIRALDLGAAPRRAFSGGQGLEAVANSAGGGEYYRHFFASLGTFEPGSDEQAFEDRITEIGADPAALLCVLDTFVNTPPESLAQLTVPVLIQTGAEDGASDTAKALADALPNGRHVTVPGNHFTALRSPQLVAEITGFLD